MATELGPSHLFAAVNYQLGGCRAYPWQAALHALSDGSFQLVQNAGPLGDIPGDHESSFGDQQVLTE
jgi:hypothetical protein